MYHAVIELFFVDKCHFFVKKDSVGQRDSFIQFNGNGGYDKFIDKVHVRYVEGEKRHWASLEASNGGCSGDPSGDPNGPQEGEALPSLTPAQLKAYKTGGGGRGVANSLSPGKGYSADTTVTPLTPSSFLTLLPSDGDFSSPSKHLDSSSLASSADSDFLESAAASPERRKTVAKSKYLQKLGALSGAAPPLPESEGGVSPSPSSSPQPPPFYSSGAGGFSTINGVLVANPLIAVRDEADAAPPGGDAPTDLLCEECLSAPATMFAQAEEELLCGRCCGLLYLANSDGTAHEDVKSGAVRPIKGHDAGRLFTQVLRTVGAVAKSIPGHECSEEDMALLRGYGADVPSAVEAPDINLVEECAGSGSNLSGANFRRWDVVIAGAEDVVSERVSGEGHAAWRGKEMVGCVMAVPNERHGAFGTASRRIAGNEMMYRVTIIR